MVSVVGMSNGGYRRGNDSSFLSCDLAFLAARRPVLRFYVEQDRVVEALSATTMIVKMTPFLALVDDTTA
jgi:hypothetical protein